MRNEVSKKRVLHKPCGTWKFPISSSWSTELTEWSSPKKFPFPFEISMGFTLPFASASTAEKEC